MNSQWIMSQSRNSPLFLFFFFSQGLTTSSYPEPYVSTRRPPIWKSVTFLILKQFDPFHVLMNFFYRKIHFSVILLRMAWLSQCRPNLHLTPGFPWDVSYASKLRNSKAAEWLRLRSCGRQKFHHSLYRGTRKLLARYKRVTAFCTSHQAWILGWPHFNVISWYNRTGAWGFVWMRRCNNSRWRTGWCRCDFYTTRWRGRWHSTVVCCARSCSTVCFIDSRLGIGQLGTGAFLVMSPHITWLTET